MVGGATRNPLGWSFQKVTHELVRFPNCHEFQKQVGWGTCLCLSWKILRLMNCFQIFAMATTSIGCSVPGCTFQTPRLPERFYPNMVDQLKVKQQHECITAKWLMIWSVLDGWMDGSVVGCLDGWIDLFRIFPHLNFFSLWWGWWVGLSKVNLIFPFATFGWFYLPSFTSGVATVEEILETSSGASPMHQQDSICSCRYIRELDECIFSACTEHSACCESELAYQWMFWFWIMIKIMPPFDVLGSRRSLSIKLRFCISRGRMMDEWVVEF